MFQGAHSLDMQRRGLLIQPLPKPPKSILQDKLEECGESGGGVCERGRGDRTGDGSETCVIQVINLRMGERPESLSLCGEEQTAGWIISASSHTINPGCHNVDSHINSTMAVIIKIH